KVIVVPENLSVETQLDHLHRFFQRACQSFESIVLGLHGCQFSFVLVSEHKLPLCVFVDLLLLEYRLETLWHECALQ
ncbi:hypothetical protein RA263_29970, partial [Pseudomonas syringae pv. tagetis]|uniref:hypothetical protein n=1 Tax=Pseudomonas syringae group genomosp. 7 TaxID=251699 RepID=UPI00376FA026